MHTIYRKILISLPAAAAVCLAAGPAAAGGPGSASAQVLKTDMSPRAAGMGGAYVAVADDAYAPGYNPAGLGQLYIPEITGMHLSGFEDTGLQNFSFVMPLPIQGMAGLDKPGLGVSFMSSDGGGFTYTPLNADGSAGSALSMDAETTRMFALSYGEKVFSGEVNLEGYKADIEQYFGLSAKYIGSEMLESYSASAFALDGGWLVRDPGLGLSMGLSLHNAGSGLKYYREATPLPAILRFGLAYQRPTVMSQSVLLSLEGDRYLNEKLTAVRAGLEYHFQEVFSFRLGYRGGEGNTGATAGLGVHYESFALDFATSLGGTVYNATQVSVSYKFTAWRTAEIKKRAVQYKRPVPESENKAAPSRKEQSRPQQQQPKKDTDFFWIY